MLTNCECASLLAALCCAFIVACAHAQDAELSTSQDAVVSNKPLRHILLDKLDAIESENANARGKNQVSKMSRRKKYDAMIKQDKEALRKRWHKLVEDLIEGEFLDDGDDLLRHKSDNSDESAPAMMQQDNKQQKRPNMELQAEADAGVDNDSSAHYKRKPSPTNYATVDSSVSRRQVSSVGDLISSGDHESRTQSRARSFTTPAHSAGDVADDAARQQRLAREPHARRILDDKFGIIKESTFTTNNHLGLKGVPRAGSEEEY